MRGLDELGWDAAGQLIDGKGDWLNCVWKTWAWETAFESDSWKFSDREFAAVPIPYGHRKRSASYRRIAAPEVLVFEPLWTVIPATKGFCRFLWSLFPHHRYLLDTDFTVNDELVKTGYAVKPIAGRCGQQYRPRQLIHEEVLDKPAVNLPSRKTSISNCGFCRKWTVKYIQVCTFTVGGNYGGTCLRGDESLVIKKESDIETVNCGEKVIHVVANPVLIMKNNQYGGLIKIIQYYIFQYLFISYVNINQWRYLCFDYFLRFE
ncbi:glutathionylspermidine synthase family protein [Escherichia coli]|nr:glutathionylspermidine synthase family protein [Escherichia coli]